MLSLRPLRFGVRKLATVAVGVSGGVDSSVAALLLRQQGHDVVGVHMTNWDAAEEGIEGCAEREERDARKVCEQLGIGFQHVSFVREYWHDVFEPLLQGYDAGGTPNPDVMCNRHIKFNHFLKHCLALGADRVATGHYARIEHGADGSAQLLAGTDASKDQSYFLACVRQEALLRCSFPLGALDKSRVREMAAAAGLHTASKRDSMGICFIGKRDFGEFLQGYLPQTPGQFVCVESSHVIGEHKGYALYTSGQRARVSGQSTRWYVVDKDIGSNVVYVCEGADHPALFTRDLMAQSPCWVSGRPPAALTAGTALRCEARIRHPGQRHACTIRAVGESDAHHTLRVSFDLPVRDVCEMQTVAFYLGDVCIGGATIAERGTTLWEEARGFNRVGWSGRGDHGVTAYVSG